MDIPREDLKQQRRRRIVVGTVVAIVGVVVITLGLSRLQPAAPTVEKSTVWIDSVKRGEMVRQVRGPGSLVPLEIRWITAATSGRVERLPLEPGVEVQPDTVLVVLTSPEVKQSALEAESNLREGEAQYRELVARLDNEILQQQATVGGAEANMSEAALQLEADEKLAKEGLIPDINLQRSRLRAKQTRQTAEFEQQRLEKERDSNRAQLAAQKARIAQLGAMAKLRRQQADALRVRAGIAGVLQAVAVEVGQQVAAGANLARVAQPDHLKAELRIPETQAKDVATGQKAAIDTRNGVIDGRVIRVDPSVREGTVTVDVALRGALPKGARPDLSVDGTIEIERLKDVLYVGRPAYGQAESTISMFRLSSDGDEAVRVPVKLGRSSVNTIEIREGLTLGDQVILSDTSQWDGYDRIRLE
jgi:HlyD family secretion protein